MFEKIFENVGEFFDMATNIVIVVFLICLICIELFRKKKSKKPGIFYMLLVIALIAYLPQIFNLGNIGFSPSSFNWWLTLTNSIGLPVYTIILIIKR